MRTKNIAIVLTLGTMMLSSCAMMNKGSQPSAGAATASAEPAQRQGVSPEVLNQFTNGWSDASRQAASRMIEKYGNPSESTSNLLIWRNIAPYKRITIFRDEVNHKFPLLHKDVIEHVVEYKVPVDRAAEVTRFNGSIMFDRTRGELAARSDSEAMNLLALNLAADILSGKKSASQARSEYGRFAVDYMNGNRTTYTEGLQFGGQYITADADQSIKINWVQAEEAKPTQGKEQVLKQAQEEEITE